MGYSANINDVNCEEISPGVIKRVLLEPKNTGRGPPGDLTVTHYTITEGGVLELDDPKVETQDYIISGTALFGRRRFLHANTTIFVPSWAKHSYKQTGESELRVLSHTYSVPHPNHRWCKTRLAQLPFERDSYQLMTEEFHGLVGAHRFHALDVQTFDVPEHTNPEETAYFMRGTARMRSGDKWYDVKPGTLVYVEEESLHQIICNHPTQYFVMEYVEQDKMWSERGYQGKI